MEARLREYRELQRRQRRLEDTRNQMKNGRSTLLNFYSRFIALEPEKKKAEEQQRAQNEAAENNEQRQEEQRLIEMTEEVEEQPVEVKPPESWKRFIIRWTFYSIVWTAAYAFFLSMQFGAVFFAVSILAGIYLNTRTHPKKKGEMSAYSVFNENCESIEGTITPEMLQRNMALGGIRLF